MRRARESRLTNLQMSMILPDTDALKVCRLWKCTVAGHWKCPVEGPWKCPVEGPWKCLGEGFWMHDVPFLVNCCCSQ
jgi:hypothetical protein